MSTTTPSFSPTSTPQSFVGTIPFYVAISAAFVIAILICRYTYVLCLYIKRTLSSCNDGNKNSETFIKDIESPRPKNDNFLYDDIYKSSNTDYFENIEVEHSSATYSTTKQDMGSRIEEEKEEVARPKLSEEKKEGTQPKIPEEKEEATQPKISTGVQQEKRVKIFGLTSDVGTKINGSFATLKSVCLDHPDRFLLVLDNGEVVKLKPINFMEVDKVRTTVFSHYSSWLSKLF